MLLFEELNDNLSAGTPISAILFRISEALSRAFDAKLALPVGLTATISNAADGFCSRALEIDSNKEIQR